MNDTAAFENLLNLTRWLLAVQVFVALLLLVLIGVVGWSFFAMREQRANDFFRDHAEDLLSRGDLEGLKTLCEERLESHPQDVWGHWYLGQYHYRREAWPDARHALRRVLDLEPSWYASVEDYMERVEDELSSATPRLVD